MRSLTPSHQNQMMTKENLKIEKMVVMIVMLMTLMGAGNDSKKQKRNKHGSMRTLGQALWRQQSNLMKIKFIATNNISMNSLII